MKSILPVLFSVFLIGSAIAQTQEEVVTGAGYADDVYYSLENGTLKTVPRSNWDIAFIQNQMSVSVLANNGAGVMLYTWNKGTIDDFAAVDTTGMDWTPMYNSIEDWEMGAFNANTEKGNDFDYGWGTYNMITHAISGDSIFIVKLPEGGFKKFAIVQKNAIQNKWTFRYADLDGQNDTTIVISAKDYPNTGYIHYSITNNAVVDQEPAERWQLLFTRYYDYNIPYYVTGVLTNAGVRVQQVNGVSQAGFKDYSVSKMSDTISVIGSDWKSFSMATFQYVVADDIVYFVQDTVGTDKSIWKIYFTGFSGSATGTYSFVKEKMGGTTGISSFSERNLTVYPNPADQVINVIHDFSGNTEFTVYNISGQAVLNTRTVESSGLKKNILNIGHLPAGIYSLQVRSGIEMKTVKFLKK